MSNVNEKKIETIRNLINDIDIKVDQLLEISEDFPSASKNAKQLKAIVNIMKIQLPALD
ncbi:MAG: hypothetical protein JSV88_04940 [Candidatus Aminicenantes bacterium]|nr:MAG: hypothetical protein JSV88_04940 [Candidatus Aminicenantes bacterium]